MEPTDTQKQIIQHLHKLLEKPGDWRLKGCCSSGVFQYHHASGLRVVNHAGAGLIGVRGPNTLSQTIIRDIELANTIREKVDHGHLLTFLESLPQ